MKRKRNGIKRHSAFCHYKADESRRRVELEESSRAYFMKRKDALAWVAEKLNTERFLSCKVDSIYYPYPGKEIVVE